MRITGKRADGSSLRTLTLALVMALLVAMLLAGTALAAGHQGAGKSAKPGAPKASAPNGTIDTATPTFSWAKAKSAAKYEVRVYQGATQVLKQTRIPKLAWKASTALPTNVDLTWKVRASNGSGSSAWSKSLTFTIVPLALAIGDPYQGGIVAYVLQSRDPGYDVNVLHGLIAATADQGTREVWTLVRTFESTGAIATALGTGSANTDKIIAAQGTSTKYAALLARDYKGGGYSDWFLPSKDELNKLFLNQDAIGGFLDRGTYWSSSHWDGPTIWVQEFANGAQNHQWRELPAALRAVRSF
jgi:hypothetical protein